LTLRNPADQPQSIRVDLKKAFELPAGAHGGFCATSIWHKELPRPILKLHAQQAHVFSLGPFEVLTVEAIPCN
jgi:hypothetical protein